MFVEAKALPFSFSSHTQETTRNDIRSTSSKVIEYLLERSLRHRPLTNHAPVIHLCTNLLFLPLSFFREKKTKKKELTLLIDLMYSRGSLLSFQDRWSRSVRSVAGLLFFCLVTVLLLSLSLLLQLLQ